MFDLPKSILKQLLSARNTRASTLTDDEVQLADRICVCTLCDYIWVRRLRKFPERCPACHKRGWNMPLVNQMLYRESDTITATAVPRPQLKEVNPDGKN